MSKKEIVMFEKTSVRRVWVEKEEKWYFVVNDVIRVLTDSADPAQYIKRMHMRDEELGKGWVQFVPTLVINTSGGKQKMSCSDVQGILRIIQSIPSPKAEPFKIWLAKVGYERLQETADPGLALERARKNWQMRGMPEKWIDVRMRGQDTRNKLTDYWATHEVKEGAEFAQLTDVIHIEWTGLTTKEHKNFKGLKRQNLRDNMTEAELIFTALAELSTNHIAKAQNAVGLEPNKVAAKKGGSVAKNARKQLENQTGKSVISSENYIRGGSKRKQLK